GLLATFTRGVAVPHAARDDLEPGPVQGAGDRGQLLENGGAVLSFLDHRDDTGELPLSALEPREGIAHHFRLHLTPFEAYSHHTPGCIPFASIADHTTRWRPTHAQGSTRFGRKPSGKLPGVPSRARRDDRQQPSPAECVITRCRTLNHTPCRNSPCHLSNLPWHRTPHLKGQHGAGERIGRQGHVKGCRTRFSHHRAPTFAGNCSRRNKDREPGSCGPAPLEPAAASWVTRGPGQCRPGVPATPGTAVRGFDRGRRSRAVVGGNGLSVVPHGHDRGQCADRVARLPESLPVGGPGCRSIRG